MKTTKLSPAKLAERKRRKRMLLWQGKQLKSLKRFRLARVKR